MERRGRATLGHTDDEGAPGEVVQVGGGIAHDHRIRRQGGTQRRDDCRRERPAADHCERRRPHSRAARHDLFFE
jgi:hypothetical protein